MYIKKKDLLLNRNMEKNMEKNMENLVIDENKVLEDEKKNILLH